MSDITVFAGGAPVLREAYTGDMAQWTPQKLHLNWGVMVKLYEAIGNRVDAMKEGIKATAKAQGEEEASGSFVLKTEFGHMRAKIREVATFDGPAIRAALVAAGLDLDRGGKVTYTISEAKLRELAQRLGVPITEIAEESFEPDKKKLEKLVLKGLIPLDTVSNACDINKTWTFDAKIDDEAVTDYVRGEL